MRERRGRILVGVVVIVLTLACARLSGATPTPRFERIAFVDQNGEIFTVTPIGIGSRRVTTSGVTKSSPAWSPDAQRLAFIAQVGGFDEVFVVKKDGAGLGRVTRGVHAYSVTWSRDGTRLLLSLSSPRGRDGIAEVLLSGRPRAQLRRFAGSRERTAAQYSPDGGSIAFQERRSIYTARIRDGKLSAMRRIAVGVTARWMGRGRLLAVAQSDAIRAFPIGGGPSKLLLRSPFVGAFDLERGDQWLVFENLVEQGRSDVPHIFVARVGSDERRDITGARLSAEEPAWQPTCTITGTPRADRLLGTAGNDVICALEGDDLIRASGGHDVVIGGDGNDTIDGGSGDDLLFGGAGRDSITSRNGGRDVVDGGPGDDTAFTDHGETDTVRAIETTAQSGMNG